jgi:DNA-binding MarR family transcriptional regulator
MTTPRDAKRQPARVIQEKWGTALEAGFQVVPNVLIRAQRNLGLDPIDVVVLLNLLAHWWEREDRPYISPSSIARRMDVTTRTVERHLKRLEEKGFLRRCRPQRSGEGIYIRSYDLQPLIGILQEASKNALTQRAQRVEFQAGLNQKEREAANQRPQVQSSGDADPSKRRTSAPPKGTGLEPSSPPTAASNKNIAQEAEEQEASLDPLERVKAMMPAALAEDRWQNALIGKACPVCAKPFEAGHDCGTGDSDDDVPF